MKKVKALLEEGQGLKARERFDALLKQHPAKLADATKALVKVLDEAYLDCYMQGVEDFCRDLEMTLPSPVAEAVQKQVVPRIENTHHWERRLWPVTKERLGRECREKIIAQDINTAAALAVALLRRARGEEELREYARFLGRAMGDLFRDVERSQKVIAVIAKTDARLSKAVAILSRQFELADDERPTASGGGAHEWIHELTDVVTGLQTELPGKLEAGGPTPEQLERGIEAFHAILRAGMCRGDYHDFIDALMIIMEYCPKDALDIEHVAGVEDRQFLELGPRARLTAVRALGRIGECETIRLWVGKLTESAEGRERIKLLAGVMGGLRHSDFFPLLNKALGRAKTELEESWIIDALGRVADAGAANALIDRFAKTVKKMGQKGNAERARLLLTALGRVGRAKGLDLERRNKIIRKVIGIADRCDRRLGFKAAHAMFSLRMGDIKPDLKRWAVTRSIEAMWGQPLETRPARVTPNGWREDMVETLRRLGRNSLDDVIETASKCVMRYCGALGALSNVLEEIGDERAAPLLESMALCVLRHEKEEKKSKLLEEKVLDAATGEMVDVDQDELAHSILDTLLKVGDKPGLDIVLDLADKMQSGQIPIPGERTASLLVDTKLKHGGLGAVVRRAEPAQTDDKEFRRALSTAKGGMMTRKAPRVQALATLGRSRQVEAVPVLLDLLAARDRTLSGAAHTALAQFMNPLPGEEAFTRFVRALLEKPNQLQGLRLEKLLDFIRREMPKRPPFDRLFKRVVEKAIEDAELAHRLQGAARATDLPAGGPAEEIDDEDGEGPGEKKEDLKAVSPVSELDKKRAYLQARRAWVAGGKKGEPPQPP